MTLMNNAWQALFVTTCTYQSWLTYFTKQHNRVDPYSRIFSLTNCDMKTRGTNNYPCKHSLMQLFGEDLRTPRMLSCNEADIPIQPASSALQFFKTLPLSREISVAVPILTAITPLLLPPTHSIPENLYQPVDLVRPTTVNATSTNPRINCSWSASQNQVNNP